MNIIEKIQKIEDNNNIIQSVFPLLKTLSFANTTFPLTVLELKVPNVNALASAFNGTNLEKIILDGQGNNNTINLYAFVNGAHSLKTLVFKNFKDNIIKSNYFNNALKSNLLEEVTGVSFDLSEYTMTDIGNTPFGPSLKEIRFVENTLKTSIAFNLCKELSDETIDSIIAGLSSKVENEPTITFSIDLGLTEEKIEEIKAKGWTVSLV